MRTKLNTTAKRINFISIQNKQTTHCSGYTPQPTRTGYERVIAHRTNDLYSFIAKEDGVVEEVSDKVLTVRYKSGASESVEIGRRFGIWAGVVMPHTLETRLEKGNKFKVKDVLAYNSDYFTPDAIAPNQVIMKTGVLARTVLWESTDTLEDSSAISEEFAKKLATKQSYIRSIKVSFDQEIRNLLKVGETVEAESILCTIENPTAGNTTLFDEAALDTLKAISSLTPKAKNAGVIEKIEVVYSGQVDDMSPSLKSLAEKSDRDLYRISKQLGNAAVTGEVDAGHRVDGQPLEENSASIRVYITGDVSMGVGDKGVFGNQMKTIVGRVMIGENVSEDGKPIDAIFGYQSIANRIVLSAEFLGTTNSLAKEIGKLAVQAYKSK